MNRTKWVVLALVMIGFGWKPAWVLALLLYEFGVRGGRDVAVFWASGHLHRGNGGGSRWHDDVD